MIWRDRRRRYPAVFLGVVTCLAWLALPDPSSAQDCVKPPTSPLVINVKDKGAKGDGRTIDTAAIQQAVMRVAGTGGTVFVPRGTYLIDAAVTPIRLKSNMTFKMAKGAVLKAKPTSQGTYHILLVANASNVTVVGGTLVGERSQHMGKAGQFGMGISIVNGSRNITVSGVTSKEMWGDGFFIGKAKNVKLCSVVADHNRRQGLSISDANGVLITNSVFKNTRGTRPQDGIDMEPDDSSQRIINVRIENSKFLDNAGNGIEIAGKKGSVYNIEIVNNVFRGGNRPILVENAPFVKSSSICGNRLVGYQQPEPSGGLNAFAEAVEVVSLQLDCEAGRDLRFEVNRHKKKKKKKKK